MQPDAKPGRNGQLLTCNHANQEKKNALACCVTLWMSLQAVGLLASTTAVALTNRSVDLLQAQVLSNLKCMSSLLWNNHSLWGFYCPHNSMNYACGECAFTCSSTCKFLGRLGYCCLLLSTDACSGNQKDKLQESRESPNFKTGLENYDSTHEPHPSN